MLTIPTASVSIKTNSSAPTPICIVCVRDGSAGTGTDNSPAPLSPSTCIRTCHSPTDISQSDPVKNCGSSFDRRAKSGVGANFAPAPVSGNGTMRTCPTPGVALRISISATPGTITGGRIVTSSRYGPAAPS